MIAVILLGLLFGSFLNVVIYRLPLGKSIVWPGSYCPACNTPIPFYDNVPVLSFALLAGKCRSCKNAISWRYPLVELLTAFCLVILHLKYGFSGKFFVYSVLTMLLIPISFIDLDTKLILNKLTIPGFILGIALVLIFHIETWYNILLGAVSGGLIIWFVGFLGKLLFRKESMGMGDVKLLVMIGVYVGFPDVAICLFFSILIAGFFIICGLAIKKLKLGETIPFGPFVALGTLVYLISGNNILDWYLGLFFHP